MLAVLLLTKMRKTRSSNIKETSLGIQSAETICCRTCLASADLIDIFYYKETDKTRVENLRLVTGVDIKINDGLPQKICKSCMKIINTALKFRIKCRNSERTLLNAITQVKDKEDNTPLKRISRRIKCEKSADGVDIKPDFNNEDNYDTGADVGTDFQSYEDPNQEYEPSDDKTKIKKVKGGRRCVPTQASYKCGDCGKEFKMKATYLSHLRFHSNFCICEECGKRCRNKYQLLEHKRARHGHHKIHSCSYCEYSSATKEALVIHERRHTGERPYVCDHCGAAFTRRSNLVQHIAIHLPEKNFQCELCPKQFKSRKFVQIHRHNAHSGRRYAYVCPLPACARRFEKPNKCAICLKKEKSRKRLQVHVYQQHRVNKYKYICPVCRDTFSRPGNVRCHLARGHGVPRALQPKLIERSPRNLCLDHHPEPPAAPPPGPPAAKAPPHQQHILLGGTPL